jgi:ubiquinone/menaquinone biosynthesis C-methylase UbiE
VKDHSIYKDIPLTRAYPDLEKLGMEFRSRRNLSSRQNGEANIAAKILSWISRLINTDRILNICVVGCGHQPLIIRDLKEAGHNVVGIEPVMSYVESARSFLGAGQDVVMRGIVEDIPLPDSSYDVALLQSVLEHVDSVSSSLKELFRITRPGGLLFVNTTNRHLLPMFGRNNEFRIPLFSFFPRILKEAYVFHHLHYDPSLADYTTRPAVHWFTYADLCALGREAGYSRFYSLLDVLRPEDPSIGSSRYRVAVLRAAQRYPWFRALALTQIGSHIFMHRFDNGDEKT